MLNDAAGFKNIYIVTGYTNLRLGIDRLVSLIGSSLGQSPFVPDTLYIFCGRRTDRFKGLVWEGDGCFYTNVWNRGVSNGPVLGPEVRELTPQQFRWLMEDLTIVPKKAVCQMAAPEFSA